ncbi:MAG: YceI family protein [Bacteroidota bacterium]|nr:YceI family protein [Bacteroidota bacterium]
MKKIIILSCIIGFAIKSHGQLYLTKTGFIGFYSKTAFEDIKAENNQVYAVIDIAKKNIAFSLLLKGFLFPKELMQEHFNENYVESDKYPKANFIGNFSGEFNINKDGIYNVLVKGELALHNYTKAIETTATLEVKGGKILGQAQFKVKPEDFNISIPALVRNKIAKEINVIVKIDCNPK